MAAQGERWAGLAIFAPLLLRVRLAVPAVLIGVVIRASSFAFVTGLRKRGDKWLPVLRLVVFSMSQEAIRRCQGLSDFARRCVTAAAEALAF